MYFWLQPRALEIVDFFRNYTAEVAGVGDVCAFSMMNLRKNGNPAWRSPGPASPQTPTVKSPQVDQAEDGKVEMSLLSFSVRNPNWEPVDIEAKEFVDEIIAKTRQKYPTTTDSVLNYVSFVIEKPKCYELIIYVLFVTLSLNIVMCMAVHCKLQKYHHAYLDLIRAHVYCIKKGM